MALMRWPEQVNGFQLSPRSQWLLYAPMWMLFPEWRKRVLSQPIEYTPEGVGMLRGELRVNLNHT